MNTRETTTGETITTENVEPGDVSRLGADPRSTPMATETAGHFDEGVPDHTIANVRTSVTRASESTERMSGGKEHDE
jgi:hypothetical protein